MGAHQIIYTSCMRGINGVNDGQQVFSPFQYRLREVVGPVGVVDLLKGHFCAQHSAAIVLSRVALQFFRPKGDYMAEVIPEPA